MTNVTPHTHPPVNADKPWRVVRYGLRHTSTIREFRRRWAAELCRLWSWWPSLDLCDTYKVVPNPDWDGKPVVDDWLSEVLHIVWGVEMGEHERHQITGAHATAALDVVPQHILKAARIDRSRP